MLSYCGFQVSIFKLTAGKSLVKKIERVSLTFRFHESVMDDTDMD